MARTCILQIILIGILISHKGQCLEKRTACPPTPNQPIPPSRVNTTARVHSLRQQMLARGMDIYIIPAVDSHLTEYVGPEYQRRKWISGFSGSQGNALVTTNSAVVAVDSRYTSQADQQVDCKWKILDYPATSILKYAKTWIGSRTGVIIGVDLSLLSGGYYDTLLKFCLNLKCKIKADENLIDIIWTDKPTGSFKPVFVYPLKYSGEKWTSKVDRVRKVMAEANTNALVLTKLDEIAWLFNLRGGDIPYNPVFYAFAIIQPYSVRLYLTHPHNRTESLRQHLNLNGNKKCPVGKGCASIHDYKMNFTKDLQELAKNNKTQFWVSKVQTNALILQLVGRIAVSGSTPIFYFKVVKNKEEAVQFQICSTIDSAAYIEFMAHLQKSILAGEKWTELKASMKLEEIRRSYDNYYGPSFETISSSGPNAALNHYAPNNFTDRALSTNEIYLLDAGSQFLGCTTDLTRTFHFGKPTPKMIETYTRVLMGFIDVALKVWPEGAASNRLEPATRFNLWKVGLNYGHGTGHGVGSFLFVHEWPNGLMAGTAYSLREGNFQSCEPGYYEPGQFGIRLETVLGVKNATTKYHYMGKKFYTFFPSAFVPFERNLINARLLRRDQIGWLNAYHRQCNAVKKILFERNALDAIKWIDDRTKIPYTSGTSTLSSGYLSCIFGLVLLMNASLN